MIKNDGVIMAGKWKGTLKNRSFFLIDCMKSFFCLKLLYEYLVTPICLSHFVAIKYLD